MAFSDNLQFIRAQAGVTQEQLAEQLEQRFPHLKDQIRIFDIGTIIGSHAGPGTVAVFFYGDERPEMA